MKALATFPSVPGALRTLAQLRKEVESAKTFEQIKIVDRTAAQIQKIFRPIKDIADEAGDTRIAARNRLAEELAKLPKATGTRGQLRGKPKGVAPSGGPLLEPPDKELSLAELGVTKKESAQARALGKVPKADQRRIVAQLKTENRDVSPTNVVKLFKEETRAAKRAEYAARSSDGGSTKTLDALIESKRKFSVIYADPPWTFEVYSGKGKERSAERHYDTMSLEQIKALPIESLAAEDCALFLWCVWPELPGALDVVKAWGFEYKTAGFVYVKQNRGGEGIFTGMGYWTRANTEPCLLATRGSPKRLNADVHQVILAPVGEHSAKPLDTHERIERLVPGPYLELFARREYEGWTTWGNEL